MKPLEFHPGSRFDSREAIDWYRSRSQTAAPDFAEELKRALVQINKAPLACPSYLHGTRRMLLSRFPFAVVFRERLHDIQVVAIAHAKRRPGYWAKRLER
jgi:plasmid stabilization system protein ParE